MTKLNLRFIATTPGDRFKGLMNQAPLKGNEGALFVFGQTKLGSFWNKNVSFPIDVGFFDKEGKLINIEHLDAHQRSPVFGNRAYKYVVEAPEGWFGENNVKLGTHYKELTA